MRKFTESKLVLATHNAGKIKEFSSLLGPYVREFPDAASLGLSEPEETGDSFAANAALKALAAVKETGLPALADDSGLAVAALDGAPGIYSARYATREDGTRDFAYGMQKLDNALVSVDTAEGETADRSAAFVAVLALAWPDGHVETFEGRCEGTLVWPPRGNNGFGYDPMFMPHGHDRTFGEMEPEEKRALSHRAIAARLMVAQIFEGGADGTAAA